MPDTAVTERIRMLKLQRGHVVAFGQTEKVKAIDAELAQLRKQDSARHNPRQRATKPSPQMETATADTSSVESAARRRPKNRG